MSTANNALHKTADENVVANSLNPSLSQGSAKKRGRGRPPKSPGVLASKDNNANPAEDGTPERTAKKKKTEDTKEEKQTPGAQNTNSSQTQPSSSSKRGRGRPPKATSTPVTSKSATPVVAKAATPVVANKPAGTPLAAKQQPTPLAQKPSTPATTTSVTKVATSKQHSNSITPQPVTTTIELTNIQLKDVVINTLSATSVASKQSLASKPSTPRSVSVAKQPTSSNQPRTKTLSASVKNEATPTVISTISRSTAPSSLKHVEPTTVATTTSESKPTEKGAMAGSAKSDDPGKRGRGRPPKEGKEATTPLAPKTATPVSAKAANPVVANKPVSKQVSTTPSSSSQPRAKPADNLSAAKKTETNTGESAKLSTPTAAVVKSQEVKVASEALHSPSLNESSSAKRGRGRPPKDKTGNSAKAGNNDVEYKKGRERTSDFDDKALLETIEEDAVK